MVQEEREMATISMNVNGKAVNGEAEDRTLLVEFIRETSD